MSPPRADRRRGLRRLPTYPPSQYHLQVFLKGEVGAVQGHRPQSLIHNDSLPDSQRSTTTGQADNSGNGRQQRADRRHRAIVVQSESPFAGAGPGDICGRRVQVLKTPSTGMWRPPVEHTVRRRRGLDRMPFNSKQRQGGKEVDASLYKVSLLNGSSAI